MTGATAKELWPLVRDYHYSKRLPGNIQHCYAVRCSGGLFGDTGIPVAGTMFSLPPTRWAEEVIELSRLIRHPDYSIPLSKLIAFSCSRLRKNNWHLVISFADWTQRHHGGIYQASGWRYAGLRERRMDGVIIDGQFKPGRSCNSKWGTRSPEKLKKILLNHAVEPHFDEGKHLYWRSLTVAGATRAKRLNLKSLPYPKPSAACPLDERQPRRMSKVQPLEAAP